MQTSFNTATTQVFYMSFHTDLGWMRPVSNGSDLIRLDWNQSPWPEHDNPDDVSRETIQQLADYLAGTRQSFTLPLAPQDKSAAACSWLNIMATIPYGQIWTYKQFAEAAGMPKASRAAGTSCSSNPIPIIYPCHRVVKSDGSLGNYGGGSDDHPQHPDNLGRKSALLTLEAQAMATV